MARRVSGKMKKNLKTPNYIPGSCNIGTAEVRRRKNFAILGSVFSVSSYLLLIFIQPPREVRLFIFLPLLLTTLGWLQVRRGFCLAFGIGGAFNFGNLGDATRIHRAVDRAADRKMVIKLAGQAALVAGILTLFAYLIPK